MNSNNNDLSRIDRYDKKRKSTTLITRLSILMAVLLVVLIGVFVFGGNNGEESQEQPNQTAENEQTKHQNESKEARQVAGEDKNEDNEEQSPEEEQSKAIKKQLIETADPNVKEAYTANWKPVGTVQSGPHTVVIEQGTPEWSEIMQAVTLATEIPENEIIAWWVTRGGEQEVITTVSDKAETETYRVYLHWEENSGYRPDKVEVLKENDQKYRYQ